MDPINPQPAQSPSYQPTPMQAAPAPEHKKVGPIIAVLVIVLVLIIGALYLFASRINEEQVPVEQSVATQNMQQSAMTEETVQPVTNTDDDLESLQNDLNTSTQGIDGQNF